VSETNALDDARNGPVVAVTHATTSGTAAVPLDHSERLPALDGLRGIAVILVILFHCMINGPRHVASASPLWAGLGWSGVDLFFVLSGFLITRILLGTRDAPGYFKNFYARRVLRIFPIFYLYLLGFYWLHGGLGDAPWLQLTHLSNFYLQQLGNWGPRSPANLTWSLSIEEQYYLVWPFVVYHLTDKRLRLICWTMIVGALLIRLSLLAPDASTFSIYVSTLARIDTFAMGALVALGLRSPQGTAALKRWPLPLFAVGIIAAGAVIHTQQTFFFWRMASGALAIFLSCLALTFASGLALIISHGSSTPVKRLFANAVLRKFGQHSYAMYLIHVEVIVGLRWLFDKGPLRFFATVYPPLSLLAFWALAFTLTLGAAVVVWHVFEKRFLALKRYFEYSPSLEGQARARAGSLQG
jgi:peptidoglycan/LPS O-acetylase OafA/YrhL